jgi:hypothetical protein
MSDQNFNVGIQGRGDGVTAISAVLNQTGQPVHLIHRKHPEYNRIMEPGLFLYDRGITPPIKWEWDANSLIEFAGIGTMWQHNHDLMQVRFKAGGNPANVSDGQVVYTRRAAFPGEQYLILGLYPNNEIRTLRSFTPMEAIWNNLQEDVLSILNILQPKDYSAIEANKTGVRRFMDTLGNFSNIFPGELDRLKKGEIEHILSVGPDKWMAALNQLSESELQQVKNGTASQSSISIAKKIMDLLGITIVGVSAAIAAVVIAICCVLAALGPIGWATVGVVCSIAGFILAITGAIGGLFLLIGWILSWFEGGEKSAELTVA